MFIFQLAATIFLRINLSDRMNRIYKMILHRNQFGLFLLVSLSFGAERRNARQFLSLKKFQGGPPAGGDECHFTGKSGLSYRSHRIAAADNRRRPRLRERFSNRDGSFGEIGNLENANRSIPQNRLSFRNFVLVKSNRRSADIYRLPTVADPMLR